MIPRIIHYCWFGRKPLPKLARKCIRSWHKYLPGWEIKEWNEDNFNVTQIPFTAEAYNAGKYAFVSDYARFAILAEHGGVYLDTDVELIKPWESLIAKAPFAGSEQTGLINPGLGFAMPRGNEFCRAMSETYRSVHFVNPDGSYNLKTICDYSTEYFAERGYKSDNKETVIDSITIYPPQVLSPKSQINGELNITEETYAIHHYAGSWLTPYERFKLRVKDFTGPAFAQFYITLKHKLTGL
ncbi:MAG: glycosyl transferase [Paramuribaculum sp.]|nr:glycosyl transferase [Paramuribaculum sp.]